VPLLACRSCVKSGCAWQYTAGRLPVAGQGFLGGHTVDRSRRSDVSCRLFPSEYCECGGDLVIAGQLRGVLQYQDGDSPFCANRLPSRETVLRREKGKHELNNRHQFRRLACEDTSTSLPVSDVQLMGVCARAEAGWYQ
jgi:hypothetical protein